MNRRKKIKTIVSKRAKQANLKENPKKAKPKYISKAERAKMEAENITSSEINTKVEDSDDKPSQDNSQQ
ncbi:DUF2986 domain-containing protein [Marinomonas transparens]|uniref:DUF2986 domain-containing protein n=1 Tax=Marinomonas transparens TaxID=2795388 RepID=A0A934JSH3_9GAMM|nr:DUF2986 domain-containing protein [Marinomonas transparens]MBJ7537527.1 DUF2986 domain-containing protein [Marinomonas transparens]